MKIFSLAVCWTILLALLRTCDNNPWGKNAARENTLYQTISFEIRNLDPLAANYTHESAVIDNIVEMPLAYHYLKRPYQLVTPMLTELPAATYFDAQGNPLPGEPDASLVARSEYTFHLEPGILYQPHPCFDDTSKALVEHPRRPQDFGPCGFREVTAEDFKTSLVRLCDIRTGSPMFGQFCGFLEGLQECRKAVEAEVARLDAERLAAGEKPTALTTRPSLPDYRKIPCDAIQIVDRHTLKYVLKRKYPQFLYWMTMHYFAPIPFEALQFYNRPEVNAAELKYVNWPVANGPYMLDKCELDHQIVLVKNPNYHPTPYPSEGNPEDQGTDILLDAGKALPFIDKIVFNWDPETIPTWTKFQQGYYDNSGLPVDEFDNAMSMNPAGGELSLSPEMEAKGIQMTATVPPISYYMAFNMRDPVVGGLGERQRLLRQAIAIALDTRQYVTIFRNGNGIMCEGILPPGIFGAAEPPATMNTVLNAWDGKESVRKELSVAKELLVQAGYPNGIDKETGNPLVIYLDHAAAGKPDFKNTFRWMADHLKQIGIQLEEKGFDLNRSRQRLSEGNWQFLYARGWVADYPDPENFLMLFASENGHVEHHGPNYSNYSSPEYDEIFRKLETMPNTPQRKALIDQANQILYRDTPVVWDFHPRNITLTHGWLHNYRPNTISYDTIKYLRLDTALREKCQREWNRPCKWPFLLLMTLFTLATLVPKRK